MEVVLGHFEEGWYRNLLVVIAQWRTAHRRIQYRALIWRCLFVQAFLSVGITRTTCERLHGKCYRNNHKNPLLFTTIPYCTLAWSCMFTMFVVAVVVVGVVVVVFFFFCGGLSEFQWDTHFMQSLLYCVYIYIMFIFLFLSFFPFASWNLEYKIASLFAFNFSPPLAMGASTFILHHLTIRNVHAWYILTYYRQKKWAIWKMQEWCIGFKRFTCASWLGTLGTRLPPDPGGKITWATVTLRRRRSSPCAEEKSCTVSVGNHGLFLADSQCE